MVPTHSSTVSQHVHVVSHLLAYEGTYGVVSQLSHSQQVSRQTLYSWKAERTTRLGSGLGSQPAAKAG